MSERPDTASYFVRRYAASKWHIAAYVDRGYGTWTLCGLPMGDGNALSSRLPKSDGLICQRCSKINDARTARAAEAVA